MLKREKLIKTGTYDKNSYQCKCCGLSLLVVRDVKKRSGGNTRRVTKIKDTFCDSICQNIYTANPHEFGLWWKTNTLRLTDSVEEKAIRMLKAYSNFFDVVDNDIEKAKVDALLLELTQD